MGPFLHANFLVNKNNKSFIIILSATGGLFLLAALAAYDIGLERSFILGKLIWGAVFLVGALAVAVVNKCK